jgi:hypothetical protein
VILSLPRCGSTTMARLLNCHPDIRCLIEPFHAGNYEGRFHRLAVSFSVDFALELIWTKWNGIKHVWVPGGAPFAENPELNDRIALGPDRKIVLMRRRNLLRRAISNLICRQTGYWVGDRAGFCDRLSATDLDPVEPEVLRRQIDRDREAIERCVRSLGESSAQVYTLYYEDVFRDGQSQAERLLVVNTLLDFLDFIPVTATEFANHWERHFDPAENRWASDDIYRMIPGVELVEEAVGCDETGWLFR